MTYPQTIVPKKHISQKRVREILVVILVGMISILILLKGVETTQAKFGTWIYSQTAEPFLAQSR